MQVIKLFLLFNICLWAEFKLDIAQNIDILKLENIVKNGWNEDNKTFNDLIISNAERVMPEILEKIKKPFEKKNRTEEDYFPVPEINLGREDYIFIVTYTKYLEFNNNIDKSLEINIDILKGLKNIKNASMLRVIYSLIVEQTVREGLSQLLSTPKDLKSNPVLTRKMPNLLTLETSTFFRAMEGEKKFLLDAWDESVYQEYVIKEHGINYPNLMMDISRKIKTYNDNFYERMFTAMKKATPEAMKNFEDKRKLERKQSMGVLSNIKMIFSGFWIKIKSLFGIEIKDFGYVSERIAHNLVYVTAPKISGTYIDYLQHLEKNKKFLKKLEIINDIN